jgi:hypothetical protein
LKGLETKKAGVSRLYVFFLAIVSSFTAKKLIKSFYKKTLLPEVQQQGRSRFFFRSVRMNLYPTMPSCLE